MEQTITFGEYVRRLRRGHHMKLVTLSERTGITSTHLSRIENGVVAPGLDSVVKLAQALGGDLVEMARLSGVLQRILPEPIRDQLRWKEDIDIPL